jgi:hypothetical protein
MQYTKWRLKDTTARGCRRHECALAEAQQA